MSNKNLPSLQKFLIDFLPLIIFFTVFKLSKSPKPIFDATIALVFSTAVILILNYMITKKIAFVALFSALILGLFGGLTIFFENDTFIKIKPTIVNSCLGLILLSGFFTKKPLLQYIFGGALHISHKAWMTLSLRWAGFFIFLSILNEIIWRNFSTDFWVKFKVFGVFPLSITFALINMPYIIRELEKHEKHYHHNHQ